MRVLGVLLVLSFGVAIADDSTEFEQATQRVAAAKNVFEVNRNATNKRNLDAALRVLALMDNPNGGNGEIRAQVTETEPNDTFATADALTASDSGTGAITPAGDRDFWSVSGASVGDVVFVVIDTEASAAGDTEMSVFENDGSTLIEFDDDSGDGLASAVVATIPTAGSIFFEFNEFGDNGVIDPYEVFQSVQNPASVTAETEPNDAFGTASAASDQMNTGDITGSADFFSFEATVGDRLAVIADNDPDGDTMLTDIEITILDTDGTTSLANEAPFTATSQNVAIFTAANTGTHFIQLTDGGNATGGSSYRFVIVGSSGTVPVELQNFSID